MIKKIIIFSLGVSLLYACSSVQEPILTSVDNVSIESNDSVLFIDSKLSVFNPNWFSIKSEKLSYLLLNDTTCFAKGESKSSIHIASGDTSKVSLSLEMDTEKIVDSLFLDDKLNIRVLGYTLVPFIDTFYFDFRYPIDSDPIFESLIEHFVSDKDLDIKSLNVQNIELQHTDLTIDFDLFNSSGINYALNSVDIKIFDHQEKQVLLGQSSINSRVFVPADSTLRLSCDARVNNISMLSTMFSKKLRNDRNLYIEIAAEVEINKLLIPVSFGKNLRFDPISFDLKLDE